VRFISDAVVEAARVRIILSLIVTADQDPRIREPLRELIRSERDTLASLMKRVGQPLDADGAAILHASIVGLAVLRVARGNSADRETRALVKRVFDELVPAMAKGARRGIARSTRKARR
jgi:hypothetical protein